MGGLWITVRLHLNGHTPGKRCRGRKSLLRSLTHKQFLLRRAVAFSRRSDTGGYFLVGTIALLGQRRDR